MHIHRKTICQILNKTIITIQTHQLYILSLELILHSHIYIVLLHHEQHLKVVEHQQEDRLQPKEKSSNEIRRRMFNTNHSNMFINIMNTFI
jgi:hypothetical protein